MLQNLSASNILPGQRIIDSGNAPTNDFRIFLLQLFNRTGQGTGIFNKVANNLTAAGTTQLTATGLTMDWNEVLTTPASSGVQLLALQPGQVQVVFNGGAHTLAVYPAANYAIDALAVNAAYSLASPKMQVFMGWQASLVRSMQLG